VHLTLTQSCAERGSLPVASGGSSISACWRPPARTWHSARGARRIARDCRSRRFGGRKLRDLMRVLTQCWPATASPKAAPGAAVRSPVAGRALNPGYRLCQTEPVTLCPCHPRKRRWEPPKRQSFSIASGTIASPDRRPQPYKVTPLIQQAGDSSRVAAEAAKRIVAQKSEHWYRCAWEIASRLVFSAEKRYTAFSARPCRSSLIVNNDHGRQIKGGRGS
jgi:hypothetical protein